jgi:hypothetical protein
MRLVLVLVVALVAHLAGGAAWAKTPKACHQCHAVCGDSISQCIDASDAACPTLPRGKARRCKSKAKHLCKKQVTSSCVATCKQAGTPVCPTTTTTTEPTPVGPGGPTTTTVPGGGGGTPTTSTTLTITSTTLAGGGGGTTTTTLVTGHVCTPSAPCTSGCFVDYGDGTIHDTCTHLQWEKKINQDRKENPADLHDADNRYSWSGECSHLDFGTTDKVHHLFCQPDAPSSAACVALSDGGEEATSEENGCIEGCDGGDLDLITNPTGTGPCVMPPGDPIGPVISTVWTWLLQLNASNFAGHNDWRLPSENGRNLTLDPSNPANSCAAGKCELESILLPRIKEPNGQIDCGKPDLTCIDSIFGPFDVVSFISIFYSSTTLSCQCLIFPETEGCMVLEGGDSCHDASNNFIIQAAEREWLVGIGADGPFRAGTEEKLGHWLVRAVRDDN